MQVETATAHRAVLDVHGVRLVAGKRPIDAVICEGEIVGLAGLEGQGQQRFLKALCGLYTPAEGRVDGRLPDGRNVPITNLHRAAKAGIAYLPGERKTEGILPVLSVLDNFAIGTLPQHARAGILRKGLLRQRLESYRHRLSMVYASPNAPITSLSGGNQQKVLLARWLAASPRVLLLNDPTRGVDMATKLKLYDAFRTTATEDGVALVLLSTEIEEFLTLCDRTLVFREDAVFAELDRATTTRASILAAMFGRGNGN